jgi:hypothetical protein
MWNDEKFRALSAPPPNAQTLFTRLLSGPELSNIPGLFSAWEAGLAQALKWPVEGFRQAFAEVSAKGMAKADWEAGLVWVPNAIAHNRPESPNVVRSWRAAWDELPECSLKREAFGHLRDFLKGMGEAFLKAFGEACPHPSPNQEQEQEQEQIPPARVRARTREARAPAREGGTTHPIEPEHEAAPDPVLSTPPSSPAAPTEHAGNPTVAARSDVETTRDGVFGMTGDAYAEGVRAVTRQPFSRLSRTDQQELQRLIDAHGAGRKVNDLLAWVRATASEFARSVEPRFAGGYRPRRCAEWLDAGRPAASATIVQRAPPSGRLWTPGGGVLPTTETTDYAD